MSELQKLLEEKNRISLWHGGKEEIFQTKQKNANSKGKGQYIGLH